MAEVTTKGENVIVRHDWGGVTVLPGQYVWVSMSAKDAEKLGKALQDAKSKPND